MNFDFWILILKLICRFILLCFYVFSLISRYSTGFSSDVFSSRLSWFLIGSRFIWFLLGTRFCWYLFASRFSWFLLGTSFCWYLFRSRFSYIFSSSSIRLFFFAVSAVSFSVVYSSAFFSRFLHCFSWLTLFYLATQLIWSLLPCLVPFTASHFVLASALTAIFLHCTGDFSVDAWYRVLHQRHIWQCRICDFVNNRFEDINGCISFSIDFYLLELWFVCFDSSSKI